jgi:hypothetical protein
MTTETQVVLNKGERHVVTIGNVVIDIQRGFQEGRALIDVYPFDDKKPMEGHIRINDKERWERVGEGWLNLK